MHSIPKSLASGRNYCAPISIASALTRQSDIARTSRHAVRGVALFVGAFVVGAASAAPIPDNIVVQGKTVFLSVKADGVQIYDCKADSSGSLTWQFREPLATLIQDGKTIGRHFAGPTWELTDRSAIVGKVVAQAPGATNKDITLLKLDVVNHQGEGVLSNVVTVQRLNTQGGVFGGACEQLGTIHNEPYTADYLFVGK